MAVCDIHEDFAATPIAILPVISKDTEGEDYVSANRIFYTKKALKMYLAATYSCGNCKT